MRAALYARVSSEEQVDGYSLDAQLRSCRAFLADHGWTLVREFIEEGRSARTDDITKRPQFKLMMEDAQHQAFDVLVVHKLDRFARNRRIAFECFDRLTKSGVGFVSLSENMDFSTPWGGLALTMLVGLAQFYSDNLSQETRKGWHERRSQGLYCGLLPFGVSKADNGVPVPDSAERQVDGLAVQNYDGLLLAFEEAANGRTDREIARLLNARGYRSAGNRGTVPLTKDTVRSILTNRFYVGEIRDGSGGWMAAAHDPLIPVELWERAQAARERNRKAKLGVAASRRVGSLSGVARCVGCGGRVHVRESLRGRQRVECYGRAQGNDCHEPSAYLDLLEGQIQIYLAGFTIPADYQESILAYYEGMQRAYDDGAARRARLEARLERLKELYGWGDIAKEAYLAEREDVQQELRVLGMGSDKSEELERLASFLRDVREAWTAASPDQKNRLARALFATVWVSRGQVVGVEPRPELEPFFRLSQQPSEELSRIVGKWRSRGDSNPRSRP
jgi:site-specific DNA recombinase